MTDSAGTPWAGRRFEHNESSADDGSAPEGLVDAIRRFRLGEVGEADVVDAVRGSRLLVPLVAHLDEAFVDEHGHTADKSAELAIVTVAGPDGRHVLPAFSSVDAMRRWDPKARPVPADAVRVALAAASENTEIVVLDPASETEFAIRRPALWAIGRSEGWVPSYLDPAVSAAVEAAASDPRVVSVALAPGDPQARLAGPELVVRLALIPGLDRASLDSLLATMQTALASHEIVATRVDSLALTIVSA
jgi:hypothetical protein